MHGEKFHFIDVREEWEHSEQNIGALCFPLGELPTKLAELNSLKNEELSFERKIVGWIALIIFIICFSPEPLIVELPVALETP